MRPGRELLIVTALALGVRVALAAATGLGGPPVEDERGYHLLAESLASGHGFGLPVPSDVVAAAGLESVPDLRAFRAPLLPLLAAPLAVLGGGVTALRIMSLVAGAACAPLLLSALRRCVAPRVAFLAALGYAAWPPLAYLSVRALTEPLSMALLIGAVLLLLRARRPRGAAVSGVVAGLSVLARPAGLLSAAALVLAAGDRRRALAFGAAVVAAVAPWVVRNWIVVGQPLLTSNAGVTLVGGNSEAAAAADPPGKWLPPGRVYGAHPRAPDLGMYGWSTLDEAASNTRFVGDAAHWVSVHPGAAARLAGWKLVRLVDPDPRSGKDDARWKAWVGWLSLGPVLLLALLGLPAAWRRRRALLPFAAPAAGAVVTAAVFYGDTRMRTAADPALLACAALGLAVLLRRGRAERDPSDLVE